MKMASKNKTIADIVAEKRELAEKMRLGNPSLDDIEMAVNLEYDANRIEAAWVRESKAIATENAVLPAVCITKPSSNAAAMREALQELYDSGLIPNTPPVICPKTLCAKGFSPSSEWCNACKSEVKAKCKAIFKARAALAEPARNCDLPLVVDGPADNNADKAWLVFKHHNPDAYFDVSGLLRCIDWLFAPAAERKGESDGR